MSETHARTRTKWSFRRTAIVSAAALVAVLAVGFLGWSYTCPCDRAPGAYLFGPEAEEPVTDWAFANQVPLCQIQISVGLLPHAINLNCMSTPAGQLYLSCSQCDTKRWSNAAVEDGQARLRLNGTVYPVTVRRVLDPAELDQAWRARVAKLQELAAAGTPAPPPDARRPDGWWSFRVASRT
jgi:hypothetical protein